MNRFFSKLNLNDIKIKPDGNSFPPDADEEEVTSNVAAEPETQVEEVAEAPKATPDFFAKSSEKSSFFAPAASVEPAAPSAPSPSIAEADMASFDTEEADMASFETEEVDQVEDVQVHSNGHSTREISYEESTALYAAVDTTVQVEERVTEIVSDGIVIGVGEVLKVSARSRPSAVAGAIAGVVREAGRAEVQAIGAGATNQAIKAVAIARDYLSESGIEAVCVPAFIDVTIENEDRTAIRLVVEPR